MMVFKGNGFLLRPWKKGDEESLAENANNVKVWRNLTNLFPHPYTKKDAKDWIKRCQKKKEKKTKFAIIIDGKAVGAIGFDLKEKGSMKIKSATIGYWLGEIFWGRGIVTKALKLVTDYIFKNFDIFRVQAKVLESNAASCRVLEKAGYKLEGRLRKHIFKEGKLMD